MGKSSTKKSKGGKEAAATAAKSKCTCDHPYNCSCGNRPPRPSKGHKWDPDMQVWAGKGHKQKGASGQTASLGQQTKTTTVGKTQVAQWQRLPSQLLQENVKRQKRPNPKYKNIEKKAGLHKYRVILPDPSNDSDKDLFFVPSHSVENEEQAKEEAALLALLHITPNLPHERKLPEPYKTTWLNAIDDQKTKTKTAAAATNKSNAKTTNNTTSRSINDSQTTTAAKASSRLTMAKSYSSVTERRKQQEARRRERNARIRRHEAVRMANQNHPVFMSAQIRKQIERLLRGDAVNLEELLDDEEDVDEEEPVMEELDDIQVYVEQRLHSEGFTKRQARTAYENATRSRHNKASLGAALSEEEWDNEYESCLQWLLVHLNEDQLPEGFDPRGRTLDVIIPESIVTSKRGNKGNTEAYTEEQKAFAAEYGVTIQESSIIHERSAKEKCPPEDMLWRMLVSMPDTQPGEEENATDAMDSSQNRAIAQEEIEALEAIFASDCVVSTKDGMTTMSISLSDTNLSLVLVLKDGDYPSRRPLRALIRGRWPSADIGVAVHVEIIKFIFGLHLGEPMIFDIHGHSLALLQSPDELSPISLLSPSIKDERRQEAKSPDRPVRKISEPSEPQTVKPVKYSAPRRPRDRCKFWSVPPKDAPPAVPFPKVDRSLDLSRKSLPAATAREEFISILKQADKGGRVVLVTGETGCGKTTQLPQFILEEFPKEAKIVVAQPRRLAATGVATRVANERGETRPGLKSVGYVVRGDSAITNHSRLVFCTTGVLLRQMQREKALDCVTHIVVDEVHERHMDTDVLLGLLKASLDTHTHLRVILMSATLEADRFAAYWGSSTPQMHIPGRTYPVKDYGLEDVLSLIQYIPPKKKKRQSKPDQPWKGNWGDSLISDERPEEEGNGGISGESIDGIPVAELVKRVDETSVDYDLIGRLVKHLITNRSPPDDGSILVFLPGAAEINKAMETIKRIAKGLPIFLLPLHGGLQPKEQNLVFRPPPKGSIKVVLSTNVAETSVTIPDCTVVIDSAREKQASFDPANRMPLLIEKFASKASLKQRRGRAGRVREGTCYRLISCGTFSKLSDYGEPEIRRCALDQTLLSLLFLRAEDGTGKFLQSLPDPPSNHSLQAATYSLRKIGAIDQDGSTLSLTPLGMHLAGIPAPPTVGKMLVMGSILGCRKAALAMAAGMSLGRSPFLRVETPWKNRNVDAADSVEAMKSQRILEERAKLLRTVGNSDHALLAAMFMQWEATKSGAGMRKQFCENFGLSFTGMRDMFQLVKQLDSSLTAAGYVQSNDSERNSNSWRIIRTCAVSALAPQSLVKLIRPAAKFHETAEGAREQDASAKTLKLYYRADGPDDNVTDNGSKAQSDRVFVHPSSANFSTASYSCPWLVFHSLVRTSKPYLMDVTECTAYAMLLFGGDLKVQASKNTIIVDDWVYLSANARIGSLVSGVRNRVDKLLEKKVVDPSFEIACTNEMKLLATLIKTDGLL